MPRLACPHCQQPVAANPIGRWYAKFQCPHCRKTLRFTSVTNVLGIAGSAAFFTMVWALVMGITPAARWVTVGAAGIWLLLMGLSYVVRGVEKG